MQTYIIVVKPHMGANVSMHGGHVKQSGAICIYSMEHVENAAQKYMESNVA